MFIVKDANTCEILCTAGDAEFLKSIISTRDTIVEELLEPVVEYEGKKYKESDIPKRIQEKRIQSHFTKFIQSILDKEAYALGYTGPGEEIAGSCLSVCSYGDTGVQKFDDEARAFKVWRSAVWAKGYEILTAVKAGEIEIPTEEELVEMLPKLEIIYSE